MLLWIIAAIVALIALYVLIGRPWLKAHAPGFFAWIEPIEIALWNKSETILKARTQMFVGVLLTVLTQAGTIDITPLMPLVPDQYEPIVKTAWNLLPLVLTVLGAMDERLRRTTTKPLELVAVPDAVAATSPTMIAAEATKVEAVAVVEEAKAAGAI